MRLLYVVTEDWYFCSHRLGLARAACAAGYDVTVVTRVSDYGDVIQQAGLKLVSLPLARDSVNPFSQILVVLRLAAIYRKERPDLVHHVALKPVVFGSLAARLVGVRRVVNALAGMGWAFSSTSSAARFLRPLIRMLLRRVLRQGEVTVQNPDDASLIRSLGVDRVNLIEGSGVDVERFTPVDRRAAIPLVVLVARLIREKGIHEFVEASRLLRDRGRQARFVLVGESDAGNRSGVPIDELESWQREGVIEWWGRRDDIPAVLAGSDIACLPSFYGEGVPMSLLEAAASGLPIVTTDSPGCREVVDDGDNGFLVPVRDAGALADALEKLIADPELRKTMGARSRQRAVERFTDRQVIDATLEIYRKLLQ